MKALYLFCIVLVLTLQSYGQIKHSKYNYDIKESRLLVKITGVYLYSVSQGTIDIDSAMVLACNANKVPLSLSYDEGYNDGSDFPKVKMIIGDNINVAVKTLVKLKNTEKVYLLLHIGGHYLFKPGNKKEDLQNAFVYINQAVQLSNKLGIPKWKQQSNILLGKYYFQAGNISQSQTTFSMVTKNCRKLNNKKDLADALENQGTLLLDNNPNKEKILNEAMHLYKETGDKIKEYETLTKILTIHFWNGNLALAKKESIQAYNFLKKIGFKHTHYNAATISYINLVLKNQKEALLYAIDAVKTMETTQDMAVADNLYMRLGNVYYSMGNIEDAIPLFKKSIKIGQKNKNTQSWYVSFVTCLDAMVEIGKHQEAIDYLKTETLQYPPNTLFEKMLISDISAKCYNQLGNKQLAEKNYMITVKYMQQLIDAKTAYNFAVIYSDISLFYANLNNGNKAKFYADIALNIDRKYKIKFNHPNLDLSLFKIDSLSGNYLSAIGHYRKFKKSNDSIENNSKRKEIEELRFKYETVKKEINIKTLQTQTNLQKNQLEKSKLLINLSAGSLLLLTIIIGLLYNLYRVKQKNNDKLEIKEKEISLKNSHLQHLLDEKEWLMKEIHHRVKNNLQTVISLLNSQSAYIDNDMALSSIKSSQHRIHSMSLIHQKLYMSENVSTINMTVYVKELVEYLKDSFNVRQRISFKIKIEQLELDVVQAVPLGLIINEAVTNSIKHACPNDQNGIIAISLVSTNEKQYLLTIQDNGIGISTEYKDKKKSFGMSLIKGLTDDLEGTFSIENNNGTLLKISFEKIILEKEKKS
jgi:two-component sensor histidine kinase